MFACYRKDDVADADFYMTACVGVLSQYSETTILRVTDPINGLPSKLKWLPTVAEIKTECERIQAEIDRATERDERREKQIAETNRWLDEQKAPRPSIEEMKERHGKNWGLSSVDEYEAKMEAEKQDRLDLLERAGRTCFERECKAAGFPADGMVSPTLKRLLDGKSAT